MGFSVQVSGGSLTLNKFTFTCSPTTSDVYLANGTLYRYSTNTYGTGTGIAVGNVTFSGANVTIDNISETISDTNYYFLLADAVNSAAAYFQLVVTYANTFATDNHGTTYPANFSYNQGYNYGTGTPYALAVSNQNTLASTATIITPGTTAIKLFAFSVTNKSASSITLTGFNINSNLPTVSSDFGTFKIYSSTTTTFPGSATSATISTSGSYITYTGLSQAIAAGATKYYWVVANCLATASTPANPQFSFSYGQSAAAISTASTTYNDFTVSGSTYNINSATVTITSQTGGTSGTTITANQTGIVLFGFGMSASSSITVSGFNINSSSSSLSSYFGSGTLVLSSTATYGGGTLTTVGSVVFNGSYANVTLTANQTITTTAKYYFLVANNIGPAPTTSTTVAFNFTSGQSSSAVIQTSPVSSYNTFTITGNTYTLPGPYFSVTGANSTTTNGITSGSLVYGQTAIVLYGFAVTAVGGAFTLNTFNIKTSGQENSYFSNAKLYRSTSSTYPGGAASYTAAATSAGAGVWISGGGYFNCNVTETIPAGTTYYYWLVADYTVNFGTAGTFTCSFASGQASAAFITTTPYTTYNTYNVTGHAFNVISSEFWTGGTSGDITNALNFTALNGATGTAPGANMVVIIGGAAYTNAPSLTTAGTTTIAGISFGTVVANPTLTIASASTLQLTSGLTVTSSNATISGGTVTLTSAATSTMGASSALTLSGTTLNNAGTYTMASTSQIGFSGTSNIANTGSFTLQSDSSGSATIGALTSGTITGTFAVQRYITGGYGHRGYYLMSSPVYAATKNSNKVYDLYYLTGSMYLTGSGGTASGFDKAGNPTIYLFREDRVPSTTSFTAGNFPGISKINNTNTYDYNLNGTSTIYNIPVGNGFMVFFRGNRGAASLTTETYSTYLSAPTVTSTATGTLNTGQIVFHDWYKPSSDKLGWSNVTANSSIRGFNLVGNPYASTIDWETYQTATTTSGIYATANVSNTIYEYDPISHVYSAYQKGGAKTGNATRYIVSGQGFYVQAAVDSTQQLIFNESAKVSNQNTGVSLFMSTRADMAKLTAPAREQHLNIQLVKDSVNTDEIYIGFNSAASAKYIFNEDAPYKTGMAQLSLTSMSSDNIPLTINKVPFPTLKSDTIPINVMVSSNGTYTLNGSQVSSLPDIYEVWLMDNRTRDSLDMRQNSVYAFNVNLGDTTTYGSHRFSLIIRQNHARQMHLLDFTAANAIAGVEVSWKTENEQGYTTFTVERSIDNGVTFNVLGGFTSSGQNRYNFLDKDAVTGAKWYRLKLEDLNGAISYSKTVLVPSPDLIRANSNGITIYPNPVQNTLNLVMPANESVSGQAANQADGYSIVIANNSGTIIKRGDTNQLTWQTDVSNFVTGTYIIQVVGRKSKRLVGQCVIIKL
ncbi:MAG: hypothetical protein JWR02_2344 [Mucilaginibacter sp.]|nr:hypothetical protein [Mucilaginibacter sp.]